MDVILLSRVIPKSFTYSITGTIEHFADLFSYRK
jgi:hypothetical protein